MINPSNITDVMATLLLRHSSKRSYFLVYFLLYENTFAREENDKRAHIVSKRAII